MFGKAERKTSSSLIVEGNSTRIWVLLFWWILWMAHFHQPSPPVNLNFSESLQQLNKVLGMRGCEFYPGTIKDKDAVGCMIKIPTVPLVQFSDKFINWFCLFCHRYSNIWLRGPVWTFFFNAVSICLSASYAPASSDDSSFAADSNLSKPSCRLDMKIPKGKFQYHGTREVKISFMKRGACFLDTLETSVP